MFVFLCVLFCRLAAGAPYYIGVNINRAIGPIRVIVETNSLGT